MKRLLVIVAASLFLNGCITKTAEFSPVPVAAIAAPEEKALAIGLLPVKDDRTDQKAGHIGALRIKADDEVLIYVRSALRNALIDKGFKIVEMSDHRSESGPAQSPGATIKTVAPILQAVKISTADAILFSATSDAELAVTVYSTDRKVMFAKKAHGENKGRLWLSTNYAKKGAKAMAVAIDNAVKEICDDPDFLEALR